MVTISDSIDIGTMQLKNRYVAAPMVVNAADESGYVTDVLVDYYERKAKGGWGLLQVEASHISARKTPPWAARCGKTLPPYLTLKPAS